MSPWTRRQVRYLESSGSPLTQAQKDKMNAELRADPSLGHHTKGSAAMKKASPAGHLREMRIEVHRGPDMKVTGHTIHHHMHPTKASKFGAFMEETHHSFPFGPDQHAEMMDHIAEHLEPGPTKEMAKNVAEQEAEEEE